MHDRDPAALAELIAQLAIEEHGSDVCTIDMRSVASYTDYFVICTGRNQRLVRALADKVVRRVREAGHGRPRLRESDADHNWLLLDYGGVVLHVFTPDARAFYRLESLWSQLPQRHHEDSVTSPGSTPEAAAG